MGNVNIGFSIQKMMSTWAITGSKFKITLKKRAKNKPLFLEGDNSQSSKNKAIVYVLGIFKQASDW